MRTHSRFATLAPSIDAQKFHRLVRAEYLAAGRLDPGYSVRVDAEGILDLVFADGADIMVVPYVVVQFMMLLFPERGPFLWPSWLPHLRADAALAIEDAVEPWLRSLAIARFVNDECTKLFGTNAAAHQTFALARESGLLGAAPTEAVLRSLSPYAYALRFAHGRTVAVGDVRGANGAALLSRVASRVDVNLGDAAVTALARAWFGLECFDRPATSKTYDVAVGPDCGKVESTVTVGGSDGDRIVEVAAPIPPYVMASFDPGEGTSGVTFRVRAPEVWLRAPAIRDAAPFGGSAGRIALVVRDDYIGAGDADVDAARALAIQLQREGFTPAIVPANHVHPVDFDLIHVFGLRCAPSMMAALQRAGNPPVPLVVTPYADDPSDELQWGPPIVRSALENASDDLMRDYYFDAIRDRNLEAPNVPGRGAARLRDDAAVKAIVARAAAMVATTEAEATVLRQSYAFSGTSAIAPALLAPETEAGEAGTLVGEDDFILAHAPMEPRCNQFALLRAAASIGYRIVFTGCVRDVHYYNEVVTAFHPGAIWLSEETLTEGELAALYRRARVFADASWAAGGLYRLARAGSSGAALVAPASGYAAAVWPGLVQTVDPASWESIARGLREAWERAPALGAATAAKTAGICAPAEMLRALMGAYAAAAGRTSSPV